MRGEDFYRFLLNFYTAEGQIIYGNFTFVQWLVNKRHIHPGFQFDVINNGRKSIPRDVLIASWEANQVINDHWLQENFKLSYHNDCRLHVLNFLIREHSQLRN